MRFALSHFAQKKKGVAAGPRALPLHARARLHSRAVVSCGKPHNAGVRQAAAATAGVEVRVAFFGSRPSANSPPPPRPPPALTASSSPPPPSTHTHRPRHVTPARSRLLPPPRAVPVVAAPLSDVLTTCTALADLAAATATSGRQDGGWLAPVSGSLESALLFFRNALDAVGVPYSYGWAIVALTAATKVATFPFTRKQVESSLAVAKLKPDIDDIKRQYGDDKDTVQRETSALYEKAGVDPAAGCAPTIATLPVFWGLYRALSNVAADGSLADGFYWIPSLSGPTTVAAQRAGTGTAWLLPLVDGAPPGGWDDAIPYLVLPVLLVLAQYASSAVMTPPKNDDDAGGAGAAFSKALILGLPLMVGWFSLNVPCRPVPLLLCQHHHDVLHPDLVAQAGGRVRV